MTDKEKAGLTEPNPVNKRREVTLSTEVTPIEVQSKPGIVEKGARKSPPLERDYTYSYTVPDLPTLITSADIPEAHDVPYVDFAKMVWQLKLNTLEKTGTMALKTLLPIVSAVWGVTIKRFPIDAKMSPWEKLLVSTPKERRGFPSFAGEVPLREILSDASLGIDYIASRMAASYAAYAYATEGKFQGQSLLNYTRADERADGREVLKKSKDVRVAIITDADNEEGNKIEVIPISAWDLQLFKDGSKKPGWNDLTTEIQFRRSKYNELAQMPKTLSQLNEAIKENPQDPAYQINVTLDMRTKNKQEGSVWKKIATVPTSNTHVELNPDMDMVTSWTDHADAEGYRGLRTLQAMTSSLYTVAELPVERRGLLYSGVELTPAGEERPIVIVEIPPDLRFVDIFTAIRETLTEFGINDPSILVPTLPRGVKERGIDARQFRIIPAVVPSGIEKPADIQQHLKEAKKHNGLLESSLTTTFDPHMPDFIKNRATKVLKWLKLGRVADKTGGNAVDTQTMLDYEEAEFRHMADRFIGFCTVPSDPELDCFTVAVNENRIGQKPLSQQKTVRLGEDYVDEFSGKPMGEGFVRYHATVSANGRFNDPQLFKQMIAFFQQRLNAGRQRVMGEQAVRNRAKAITQVMPG